MFRSGIAMVLTAGLPDIEIFEAGSLEQAMAGDMAAPSVILLDLHLQGLNGMESIAILQRRWPGAAIIMLSSYAAEVTVREALERGAIAFVAKADTAANMVALIQRVLLAPAGETALIAGAASPAQPRLTPRQSEVLDLVCLGLSNKLIGRRLDLSENTVRGHVQALMSFLEVSSRTEAAFEARQRGLVA